jgi:hypothetical protein
MDTRESVVRNLKWSEAWKKSVTSTEDEENTKNKNIHENIVLRFQILYPPNANSLW